MIAVVASLFLLLYVLVPGALFRLITSLTLPVKKFQKTKTQEITFAVVSSFLPFWLSVALVWSVAAWPFPIYEGSAQRRMAYRTVFMSLASDKKMDDATQEESIGAARTASLNVKADFFFGITFLSLLRLGFSRGWRHNIGAQASPAGATALRGEYYLPASQSGTCSSRISEAPRRKPELNLTY